MTETDETTTPPANGTEQTPPTQDIPTKWLANFLPMFIGQVISLLGSSLVQFALVWYVTKLTGSAAVLATATTAALIPVIFFGPFVGALVWLTAGIANR